MYPPATIEEEEDKKKDKGEDGKNAAPTQTEAKGPWTRRLPTVLAASVFSWLRVTDRQALRECSRRCHELAQMPLAACTLLVLQHSSRSYHRVTHTEYKLRVCEIRFTSTPPPLDTNVTTRLPPVDVLRSYPWRHVASTLCVLRLIGVPTPPPASAAAIFPLLTQLHTLEMHDNLVSANDRFLSASTLASLPAITCLHLPQYVMFNLASASFPKLRDLSVELFDLRIDVARAFPVLERLCLQTILWTDSRWGSVTELVCRQTLPTHVREFGIYVYIPFAPTLCRPFASLVTPMDTITRLVVCANSAVIPNWNPLILRPLRHLTSLMYLELQHITFVLLPVLPSLLEYVLRDSAVDPESSIEHTFLRARVDDDAADALQPAFPNLETLRCTNQRRLTNELIHVPRLRHLRLMATQLDPIVIRTFVTAEGRRIWPLLERVSTDAFTLCLTGASAETLQAPKITETFTDLQPHFTPLGASRWNDHLRPHRAPSL